MLWMMLERSRQKSVEGCDIFAVVNGCMTEWQIFMGTFIQQDIHISSLLVNSMTKIRGRAP
jgi:hypothetical protein